MADGKFYTSRRAVSYRSLESIKYIISDRTVRFELMTSREPSRVSTAILYSVYYDPKK